MGKDKVIAIVLVLVSLTMLLFGEANAYELLGGGLYTRSEFSELNSIIGEMNDVLETYYGTIGAEVKYLDYLNSGSGGYAEFRLDPIDGWAIGVASDYFSTETDASVDYSDSFGTFNADVSLKVEVTSVIGTISRKISKYISVCGGIGYYFITNEGSLTASGTGSYSTISEDTFEKGELTGVGGTVGGEVNYPLNDSFNLFAKFNYRVLEAEEMNLNGGEFLGGATILW